MEMYGSHFIAGYTTAASYDALVTLRQANSKSSSGFSAGLNADVPIPQAGGAVNIATGLGFSQCSTSLKQEEVLCIRVKTLGVSNAAGFHPASLKELDKEMSQFGKQQGCGAKYEAITLPYSLLPNWQALEDGSCGADYAPLLSSHMEVVITMLNKVDFLLNLYLSAAEQEQDKRPSEGVNKLSMDLRVLQVNASKASTA